MKHCLDTRLGLQNRNKTHKIVPLGEEQVLPVMAAARLLLQITFLCDMQGLRQSTREKRTVPLGRSGVAEGREQRTENQVT